jgi:hypothetical protein
VLGSCVGAEAAFSVYYQLPDATQRAGWTGPWLNQYAPALGGLVVAMALFAILRRRGQYTPALRAHFTRSSLWYGLVGLILWVNYLQRGISDFGLWSQLINWPLAGLLAGLAFDLLATAFLPFLDPPHPAV